MNVFRCIYSEDSNGLDEQIVTRGRAIPGTSDVLSNNEKEIGNGMAVEPTTSIDELGNAASLDTTNGSVVSSDGNENENIVAADTSHMQSDNESEHDDRSGAPGKI